MAQLTRVASERTGQFSELSPLGSRPTGQWKTVSADDQRLIADCLEGRTEAFGQLVCRYQDRLYNTVFRLVENPEDARDVVQDAFLSAYQSLGALRARRSFLLGCTASRSIRP